MVNYTIRRILVGPHTKEVTIDWWIPAKTVNQTVADDGTIVRETSTTERVAVLVDTIAVPLDADDDAIVKAVEDRRPYAAAHWETTKGEPSSAFATSPAEARAAAPHSNLIGLSDA